MPCSIGSPEASTAAPSWRPAASSSTSGSMGEGQGRRSPGTSAGRRASWRSEPMTVGAACRTSRAGSPKPAQPSAPMPTITIMGVRPGRATVLARRPPSHSALGYGARANGREHGVGDVAADARRRAGEGHARAGQRGDAEGVRGGAGRGAFGVGGRDAGGGEGLRLGLDRGLRRAGEAGVGERGVDEHEQVDRPRGDGPRPRAGGGERVADADRGEGRGRAVPGLVVVGDVDRGEHAHDRRRQRERAGALGQVGVGVGARVVGRHGGVEPGARSAEAAAEDGRGERAALAGEVDDEQAGTG